jgi:hypothetical protein
LNLPDHVGKFDFVAEMEIDMQASILETKSMDLVSITLLMVIVMKGHGMKAASKAMACIPSGVATQDVVYGMVAPLSTLFCR